MTVQSKITPKELVSLLELQFAKIDTNNMYSIVNTDDEVIIYLNPNNPNGFIGALYVDEIIESAKSNYYRITVGMMNNSPAIRCHVMYKLFD